MITFVSWVVSFTWLINHALHISQPQPVSEKHYVSLLVLGLLKAQKRKQFAANREIQLQRTISKHWTLYN